MRINKTIIYVNFSPYTNAGYFQDFLINEYTKIIVFTFKFYSLGKTQEQPNVSIFFNGSLKQKFNLFQLPVPRNLIFLLLPIRSFIFFVQLTCILLYLKPTYGPFHTFITVNALMAWIGNVLRKSTLIHETIYWVWDYYPPINSNKVIQIMRGMYGWFDASAIRNTSRVVFLNEALAKQHQLKSNSNEKYPLIGIGTKPQKKVKRTINNTLYLVFFGVIKKSEGLDLVFDALRKPLHIKQDIVLHIIGNGPDISHFMNRKNEIVYTTIFHGYIQSDEKVAKLLNSAHIGLATYLHEESSVTKYTDPSKIKRYISHGLPVITTDFVPIAPLIQTDKAGVIIKGSQNNIRNAVSTIASSYDEYSENSYNLSKQFYYKKLYRIIFNDKS